MYLVGPLTWNWREASSCLLLCSHLSWTLVHCSWTLCSFSLTLEGTLRKGRVWGGLYNV